MRLWKKWPRSKKHLMTWPTGTKGCLSRSSIASFANDTSCRPRHESHNSDRPACQNRCGRHLLLAGGRSIQGAISWYLALGRAFDLIQAAPESHAEAPESHQLGRELRQAFF